MDNASTIAERLDTLKTLHENGIYTIVFMSPMFPYITDFKAIIERSKDFIDEYWLENLNLRGDYKATIMNYIQQNYLELYDEYKEIYNKNNKQYWIRLSQEIKEYCESNNINYKNYFYHEELVREKANSNK